MTRRSWSWDLRPLAEFQAVIDDVLHDIAELGVAPGGGSFPAVAVRRTAAGYQVNAAVPGLKREEIELSVRPGRITLQGTRNPPAIEGSHALRSERFFGRFEKTIPLPEDADPERVRARLADGVLRIDLPFRSPGDQRVEIDVEGA